MKTSAIFFTSILFLAACHLAAQEFRGAELGFTISNSAGRSQFVILGISEGASSGIDPTLYEAELPPVPPNEIFDARIISTPAISQLGLGTLRDYRAIGSIGAPFTQTYTIAYQGGINSTSV